MVEFNLEELISLEPYEEYDDKDYNDNIFAFKETFVDKLDKSHLEVVKKQSKFYYLREEDDE